MIDQTYSTIVSLLPYTITEIKPGLTPKEYIIVHGNPGLTIIPNNAFYLVNPDPLADAKDVRHIKVPVPSIELAQSIINDFVTTLLAVEPPDVVPAMFAVAGNYDDVIVVNAKFNKEINFYKQCQIRWFERLVDIADDAWSKSRSPLSISDVQRQAAKMLGREREWINPTPTELQEKCPYCQSPINMGAVKCVTCHEVLDKKKYAELVGTK